jgi:hypothetical protein
MHVRPRSALAVPAACGATAFGHRVATAASLAGWWLALRAWRPPPRPPAAPGGLPAASRQSQAWSQAECRVPPRADPDPAVLAWALGLKNFSPLFHLRLAAT